MISFNDTTSYVSCVESDSSLYSYNTFPIVYNPDMLVTVTDNNDDTFLIDNGVSQFTLVGDELTTYLNSLSSDTRIEYTDIDSLLVV